MIIGGKVENEGGRGKTEMAINCAIIFIMISLAKAEQNENQSKNNLIKLF